MTKGMKIGLSVLAVGITATAVFLILKRRKKKKEEETIESNLSQEDKETIVDKPVDATTNPPTETQINAVVNSGGVPFKNRTEGNAFRAWINDTYPTYAREIDLDRTGSYNNSYITKAWQKYGTIYTQTAAPLEIKQKVATEVNTAAGSIGQGVVTNVGVVAGALLNTLTGTTGSKAPTGAFSAKANAQALKLSMDGYATDEDLFWDITNKLSHSQKKDTRDYFDRNLGRGENLGEWIAGDFSFGAEDRALDAWGYRCNWRGDCNKKVFWV